MKGERLEEMGGGLFEIAFAAGCLMYTVSNYHPISRCAEMGMMFPFAYKYLRIIGEGAYDRLFGKLPDRTRN